MTIGLIPAALLLGPRQCPNSLGAAAAAAHACCGRLAGAEQQACVYLVEWLPGVRIEQLDGRRH